MGKTLPVTTNCTNERKKKKKTTLALADIICSRPWFPLNVAPAAQTAPLVIQLCLCQVWQAERCLRKLTWSPGKRVALSLSPWQAVNHLRWRAAWRRSLSRALPASTVQTVVLLVCLPFCSQPAPVELFFLSFLSFFFFFYFQLLFISPRRADKISLSFPTLSQTR